MYLCRIKCVSNVVFVFLRQLMICYHSPKSPQASEISSDDVPCNFRVSLSFVPSVPLYRLHASSSLSYQDASGATVLYPPSHILLDCFRIWPRHACSLYIGSFFLDFLYIPNAYMWTSNTFNVPSSLQLANCLTSRVP